MPFSKFFQNQPHTEPVELFQSDQYIGSGRFYQADKGFSKGGIVHLDAPMETSELESVNRLVGSDCVFLVQYEQRSGDFLAAFEILGTHHFSEGDSA